MGGVFYPRRESNSFYQKLKLKDFMEWIVFGLLETAPPLFFQCQNNLILIDSLCCLISPSFKSCPWRCSLGAFKPSWDTGLLPLEMCPVPVLTPWHPSISGYWSLLSHFLLATVLFLRLGLILTSVFMWLCPICHSGLLCALLGFSFYWPGLQWGLETPSAESWQPGLTLHIHWSPTRLVIQPGGCLGFPSFW